MWIVLRPEHKIHLSQAAFAQANIDAVGLALQSILPSDNVGELVQQMGFEQCDRIIFTSKIAAQLSLPFIPDLPSSTYIYGVGKTTFQTLAQWTQQYPFWCNNHQLMMPQVDQQTSEGLLQLPSMQSVSGKSVIIVKGHGGRNALAQQLGSRGADVQECCVYSRTQLSSPIASQPWELADITGMIVTSHEQLQLAFDVYPHFWLSSLKWIMASQRIADYASTLGIHNITIAQGADDAALIHSVQHLME